MGYQFFKRQCSIQVNDLLVTNLRIKFKAIKTLLPQPNTLECEIYNLAPATRSRMQSKGAQIILQGGYLQHTGTVFSGLSRTIDHERLHDGNVVTKIQCGDGEQQWQFNRAKFSLGANASPVAVAKNILAAMGINSGNALQQLEQGNFRKAFSGFPSGYSAHGPAAAEFDKLMTTLGLTWSIQDGAVQVLQQDSGTTEQIYNLTPDTGLIGSPIHGSPDRQGFKSATLTAKSFLIPELRPGKRVYIADSAIKQSLWYVAKGTYIGDTSGNDWYNELELRPPGANLLVGVG